MENEVVSGGRIIAAATVLKAMLTGASNRIRNAPAISEDGRLASGKITTITPTRPNSSPASLIAFNSSIRNRIAQA